MTTNNRYVRFSLILSLTTVFICHDTHGRGGNQGGGSRGSISRPPASAPRQPNRTVPKQPRQSTQNPNYNAARDAHSNTRNSSNNGIVNKPAQLPQKTNIAPNKLKPAENHLSPTKRPVTVYGPDAGKTAKDKISSAKSEAKAFKPNGSEAVRSKLSDAQRSVVTHSPDRDGSSAAKIAGVTIAGAAGAKAINKTNLDKERKIVSPPGTYMSRAQGREILESNGRKIIDELPPGAIEKIINDKHHHHHHHYYKRYPYYYSGYYWYQPYYYDDYRYYEQVAPPIGAEVDEIDENDVEVVVIDGTTYYLSKGTYYKKTDTGYIVVDPYAQK